MKVKRMAPTISRGKVLEVRQEQKKLRAGQGLLAGLAVVWHHWGKSWTQRLTQFDQIAGTFTVEYPEQRIQIAEAYRNVPILLYDDETGQEFCTSCFQCERICPPQVIHMQQAKHPETGKPVPAVSEFIIEYDACMGCGLCHEVCPFEAIKMDRAYELSTHDHPSLTVRKRELLRPVSYYQAMAPNLWEQVKDNAYKKLEGNQKRRVGSLGIAPQAIEAGKVVLPPPPAPAGEAEVGAEVDGPQVQDKAAKLAAIRAKKAAQKATAEGAETGAAAEDGTEPPSPAAAASAAPSSPPLSPVDEKAARLAAIRAQKAAERKAREEGEGAGGTGAAPEGGAPEALAPAPSAGADETPPPPPKAKPAPPEPKAKPAPVGKICRRRGRPLPPSALQNART
ncbi:MAG: 4Fe-4S dicluster domain-containing protein, partial [Chloroflexaceae bacterium]|nr:4Fe-4S dicluster domain-containing protein [Chloroflexaceae bacterium]